MQIIIKNILLQYTLTPFIFLKRKALRVLMLKNFLNMRIHRKSLQVMKGKKTNTVYHLSSNSAKFN